MSPLAPWPHYEPDEIAAVGEALASGRVNYWTGAEGKAFERDYAAHCGVKHAIAVANGTNALELALHGIGIGPGDEVIVPARTFIATAGAVVTRGARPVVVDVDAASLNLTAATVAPAITARTKAIIPVHLNGWPVDMRPLMELAARHKLKVIEDCAQAHGARDRGRPVGAIGNIGCFSFCQDKIISTGGEGGMVVTDDAALFKRMWAYRDHGRDYDLAHAPKQTAGFQWLTTDFGTNWRMTEAQSVIGRKQLAKLPRWLARRRAIAAQLSAAIAGLNAVQPPAPPREVEHAFYKYMFQVDPAALRDGWSRERVMAELEAQGIPARVGGCPDISREEAFRRHGFATPALTTAAWLEGRTLMLPVHPTLSDDNVAFMADTLRAILNAALR